jgi:antitoxin (DNA-binding transcriptional repressor) of toxin-antitoxin stability system
MLTIAKEDIEKNFPKYLSLIEQTGEDILVTSDNVPWIKLTSLTRKRSVADAFQDVRGKIKYHGDVLQPETENWDEI